jgi:mannose/fructose/N-acetylgalactosamine-specific phosphotransferase system component IID
MNTINNEINVLECFFQFSSTMNKYFLEKMVIPKLFNLCLTHLAITICYKSCSPALCIIFLFHICILLD